MITGLNTIKKNMPNSKELKEVRCWWCGKLLGRIRDGASYEIKCSRCGRINIKDDSKATKDKLT